MKRLFNSWEVLEWCNKGRNMENRVEVVNKVEAARVEILIGL